MISSFVQFCPKLATYRCMCKCCVTYLLTDRQSNTCGVSNNRRYFIGNYYESNFHINSIYKNCTQLGTCIALGISILIICMCLLLVYNFTNKTAKLYIGICIISPSTTFTFMFWPSFQTPFWISADLDRYNLYPLWKICICRLTTSKFHEILVKSSQTSVF